MEAFGVAVSRLIPSISAGSGVEPQPHNAYFSVFFGSCVAGTERNSRASRRSLKLAKPSNFAFSDQSYLDYYSSGRKIRCRACRGKVKQEKVMKKRQKMLKGLSRDLAVFSEMGSDPDNALVDPVKAKMISKAAELLQGELQKLWSEEKELKALMQNVLEGEMSSSSSSSESSESDSDCGAVVNTNLLNCNSQRKQFPENEILALPSAAPRQDMQESIEFPKVNSFCRSAETQERNSSTGPGSPEQEISKNARDGVGLTGSKTPAAKKIEVCMGRKCEKSGAASLMEEFRRVLGIEGSVSGCKCMGKCRDGPNVRILSNFDEHMRATPAPDHVKPSTNQFCFGVGLEDVDSIVDNFLGGSRKKFGLGASS